MRLLGLGADTRMWATAFTSWYRIDVIAVEPSEAMRPVAVHPHRPARHRPRTRLLGFYGVGPDTAAALLLIAVGDHPERLRSAAAWAHMCAVVPIPASSAARCKEAR